MSNTSSEYDKNKSPSLKFDKPNTRQTTLSDYKIPNQKNSNRKSVSPKPEPIKNHYNFLKNLNEEKGFAKSGRVS